MYITDIVYLLDVLVVIVYMLYCNCWDYLLLHEDWGECSEDWPGMPYGFVRIFFLAAPLFLDNKCETKQSDHQTSQFITTTDDIAIYR